MIYENEHWVILDKPTGWLTHADGRTAGPTVADWLLARYPGLGAVGEPMRLATGKIVARPGIVHRLDRETSGVMAAAKNETTYRALRQAFAARRVRKSYRLLVIGQIKSDEGVIDSPIGRSQLDPRRRTVFRRGLIRRAVTEYRVLHRFSATTYLEAYPETGRTHQLRVHFKSIQHPLIGDQLYGSPVSTVISRTALHAYCLELPPLVASSGSAAIFLAPLPLDFFTALALLGEL